MITRRHALQHIGSRDDGKATGYVTPAAASSCQYVKRVSDDVKVGDPVTLRWYEPGEVYRPQGKVDAPTAEELARLRDQVGDVEDGEWVLVHWRGPATAHHRRWERRADLRRDAVED